MLLTASMRARGKRSMRWKADLSPQLKVHGDVAHSGPQIMQLAAALRLHAEPQALEKFSPPANGSLHPSRFQVG